MTVREIEMITMAPHLKKNTVLLGKEIRDRRLELGLTIEGAATKAGVSQKTWIRYESGSSIRLDKVANVLKVLKWTNFPDGSQDEFENPVLNVDKSHRAWSEYLEHNYGPKTAACFAVASVIVLDEIKEDLQGLENKPRGTHLGQLDISLCADKLPPQFLMRYDYEFVYALKHTAEQFIHWAKAGSPLNPHTVLDELFLYLIEQEIDLLYEMYDLDEYLESEGIEGILSELAGDIDLYTCLYSGVYLVQPGDIYHFDNWLIEQFWDGD